MKTLDCIRFALFTVAALFTHAAFGADKSPLPPAPLPLENWRTVDDFTYATHNALTVAPNGVLYAAGYTPTAQGDLTGLIRASADGGNSWVTTFAFTYPGLSSTLYSAIAADAAGNLYVSALAWPGGGAPEDGPAHWIVQRSSDGGATWVIVDDYVPGGWWWLNQNTTLAVDTAGNIFVGYPANNGTASTYTYWTIRRGIAGANFTTVDVLPSPNDAGPQGLYAHATSGLFAVGSDRRAWIVRRSRDGGNTWQTVNTFQLVSGYTASANGIAADAFGNLYAVGSAYGPAVRGSTWLHWVVRKSSDGGNSWITMDDFQLDTNNHSAAGRFLAAANGNLYVAGFASSRWVVRKSAGGAGSWTTVDNFQYAGSATAPHSIANAFGKVLVAGSGGGHWLVRRSP